MNRASVYARWSRMLVLAGAMVGVASGQGSAAPVVNEAYFYESKNRIEIHGSYDAMKPSGTYGAWKSGGVTYYRKAAVDTQWYVGAEAFSRREGSGKLGEVGVYKDWNNSFYTYTALSAGSNVEYLPKVRFDHDFNFKLGQDKKHVWTVGLSNIKYHNDHRDFILSTGITRYVNKWVMGYRVFKNTSHPGSVGSYAHEISVANGKEGQQWTTLSYSFGKQAYLATALATPETVRNNSKLIRLQHRHWLDADQGYFAEVRHFDLTDGYSGPGFTAGYFWEY